MSGATRRKLDQIPAAPPFGQAVEGVGAPARATLPNSGCATALLLADGAALALALAAVVLAAWVVRSPAWSAVAFALQPSVIESPLAAFMAAVVAVMIYFAVRSHYRRRMSFWTELQDIFAADIIGLLCNGFVVFLQQQTGARLVVVAPWLVLPIFIVSLRRLARGVLQQAGRWQIRTVVVGDGETARQAIEALRSEPWLGYEIVHVASPSRLRIGPGGECWRHLLTNFHAGLLVVACDSRTSPGRKVVEALVRERVPFAMMPQLDGLPVLGFEHNSFFSHDTVMLAYRNNLARPMERRLKLALDCAAAICGLLVLAPVLCLIALLVKLDGGPVLFSHTRVGLGGRKFQCLKFRSMVQNSSAVLQHVLQHDSAAAAEWAQTRKLRNDPRITWIGKVLRSTSLDELPQLFNVLRLEMSLVGPRPIVDEEVPRYGMDIAFYYEARPGLTGLWQVSGRTQTSYAQRVQLDTWYIKNWTIWHDFAIIAKTIPAVLRRRGAY